MKGNVAARAAIVAIGVVVLVIGAVPATASFRSALATDQIDPTTTPTGPDALRLRDRIHHAQFECIRGSVLDQVPPGSVVHVPLDPTTLEADLWQQRLIELAFPVATIAEAPGPGVLTLRIIADPASECGGVRLVVEQG